MPGTAFCEWVSYPGKPDRHTYPITWETGISGIRVLGRSRRTRSTRVFHVTGPGISNVANPAHRMYPGLIRDVKYPGYLGIPGWSLLVNLDILGVFPYHGTVRFCLIRLRSWVLSKKSWRFQNFLGWGNKPSNYICDDEFWQLMIFRRPNFFLQKQAKLGEIVVDVKPINNVRWFEKLAI